MNFDDIIARDDSDARIIKEAIVRLSVLPGYTDKTLWEIFYVLVNEPILPQKEKE